MADKSAVVFDLYSGRTVKNDNGQTSVRVRRNETRLFFGGPKMVADNVRAVLRVANPAS